MATRKTSAQTTAIPEEELGNFAISDHEERLYKQVYYAIRDRYGLIAKQQLGEAFSWDSFKVKFAQVFGVPEERKFTLKQLLAFAKKKLGMNQEQLVNANKVSWERRREWQAKQEAQQQTSSFPTVRPVSNYSEHYDQIPN
jgi:hypothetical protein